VVASWHSIKTGLTRTEEREKRWQDLRASLAIISPRFHLMASGSKDRSIASTSIDHHLIKFLREFYRPQIFADN
jgi:hypothetical protein